MGKKLDTLDHFLFNSDYPADKIVWFNAYVTESLPSTTKTVGIDMHNQPRTIFVRGLATLDKWKTTFVVGSPGANPDAPTEGIAMRWYDKLNGVEYPHIRVEIYLPSQAGKELRVLFWGVQREDIPLAIDYGKTSQMAQSTRFTLDTDFNYPRLIMDGIAKGGDTITHDLGHIPYCDWWYFGAEPTTEDPLGKNWIYTGYGSLEAGDVPACIRATNETLTFVQRSGQSTTTWYYYRIYG